MKNLVIHFRVGGYCAKDIEVPDDYQIPSTNPSKFWKDIRKRFPKQVETDIMKLESIVIDNMEFGGFYIEQLVLDYFQKVYILEGAGNTTEVNLDHIPLHQ